MPSLPRKSTRAGSSRASPSLLRRRCTSGTGTTDASEASKVGPAERPPGSRMAMGCGGAAPEDVRLMELREFRSELDRWLDANEAALASEHAGLGTLDEQMVQLSKVKRLTFDAGWMRWGWPQRVGGLGGSSL